MGEGKGGDGVGAAEGGVHSLDHGGGVQAQGGEVMGGKEGGGGQGGEGVVNRMINNLEKSNVKRNVSSKFAKPYGKRGVRKDGLIQARIESFESKGIYLLQDYVEVWARESCR